jgi:hypothetical protein
VRQVLCKNLPTLAFVYGLTPADVDDLTPREALEFLDQLPRFTQPSTPTLDT